MGTARILLTGKQMDLDPRSTRHEAGSLVFLSIPHHNEIAIIPTLQPETKKQTLLTETRMGPERTLTRDSAAGARPNPECTRLGTRLVADGTTKPKDVAEVRRHGYGLSFGDGVTLPALSLVHILPAMDGLSWLPNVRLHLRIGTSEYSTALQST